MQKLNKLRFFKKEETQDETKLDKAVKIIGGVATGAATATVVTFVICVYLYSKSWHT